MEAAADPFDLKRFVDAQAPVYQQVVTELGSGRKRSHWMWFIFPQMAGLGVSPMAQRYAIGTLAEARGYLGHPLLGTRLRECTRLVLNAKVMRIQDIFCGPDDLKFHSSMTLFAAASADDAAFNQALDRYFGGARDGATLARLR